MSDQPAMPGAPRTDGSGAEAPPADAEAPPADADPSSESTAVPGGSEAAAVSGGSGAAAVPAGSEPVAIAAAVEPASPDVALADEASPLPGAHRGGFQRLPTAPVEVTTVSAPAEPGTAGAPEPELRWLMPEPAAPHRGLANWALGFSIAGLLVSLFVGWGFPIGLVGVFSAILALRRPLENRAVAIWALVLGAVSVLYSAGWLLYAASRANLFG